MARPCGSAFAEVLGVAVNYYNEFDPKAAQWLRNLIKAVLIPDGVVDERSIIQVQAADLVGYRQCHFFAGIGGWSLALQLAGWPADRRVWTGSCPCQPYSAAGKQKGDADERNLWPAWYQLLREFNARYPEQKPDTIFGEQVDKAIRHGWLDGICRDLEAEGYACGHAVLGSHSVGAKRWIEIVDEYTGNVAWRGLVKTNPPHIRQRLYWVAESDSTGRVTRGDATSTARHRGAVVADGGNDTIATVEVSGSPPVRCSRLGDSEQQGLEGHGRDVGAGNEPGRLAADTERSVATSGSVDWGQDFWSDCYLVPCRDGKYQRVESGLRCLVNGVSFELADGSTSQESSRTVILKGLGNAIVPQVAAEFISAYMETVNAAS